MNEKQLQSKIVIQFSQNYPERYGSLWANVNRTLSERDGQTQKAMGLFKGVSDLIYFYNGRFVGLEVKVTGKTHETSHIKKQIEWGETIVRNEGEYYFITSYEDLIKVLNFEKPKYTIEVVNELIINKKTIIF